MRQLVSEIFSIVVVLGLFGLAALLVSVIVLVTLVVLAASTVLGRRSRP
ncbi:hypothetical protein AB0395_34670 [Streptosporangium sp. NPDC051023]